MWSVSGTTSTSAELDALDYPDAPEIEAALTTTASHPIYPYSVIPGGAHSRQDLLDAINRDQVVAAHYRNLSPDRMRVERLPEERRAYVSYRMGDRIYWTKEKVTLPAGEPILTDGVTQIRARCGNCIAFEPQLPTSDEEPDAVEFEALAPPAGNSVASLNTVPVSTNRLSPVPLSVTPAVPASGGLAASNGASSTPSNGGPSGGFYFAPTGSGLSATPTLKPAEGSGMPNLLLPTLDASADQPIPGDPMGPGPGRGGSGPGGSGPDGTGPGGTGPGGTGPGGTGPGGPGGGGPGGPGDPGPSGTGPGGSGPGGPGDPGSDNDDRTPSIPEPSTLMLLGAGAAGALWRRVRSRRAR